MDSWVAATRAAVEVGDAVAAMREPLAAVIAAARDQAQSRADRFAHDRLDVLLSAAYPGVPIVSEEDASHDDDRPSTYWLIDPIDGTASWSAGYAGFVCQFALIADGSVEFGAIHAPVLGMTWTAVRGQGAFVDGTRLPRRRGVSADPVVVIDNYPEPRGVCERVMRWLGTTAYVESGSIGLKAALVASGRADLFVKDVVVRDWDVAPALAIMAEVGGFASRVDGSPYVLRGSYEKTEGVIFAANRELGMRVASWLPGDRAVTTG